jgi:DinB superfamily
MLPPPNWEEEMLRSIAIVSLVVATTGALSLNATPREARLSAHPQAASASAPPAQDASPVANPISSTVKAQLARFGKNMVAAAESMPAEKYTFKPSPEMNNFGHLVMHIAQSNNFLCGKISGTDAPEAKLAGSDSKDKLVAALKASFDFCGTALARVHDSNLGAALILFGNRPSSRGAALVALSDGWNDHYGAQAIYLRLNGILPPTAQPQPAKQ